MNMTTRDRRALIGGGLLLAVLLGYVYVGQPMIERWAGARAQIALASERQAELRDQLQRLRIKQSQLASVYGGSIGVDLPPVEQARIRFLDTVERLLRRSRVEGQSVRAQPVRELREVSGVSSVGLQLTATGDFGRIADCLAEMAAAEMPMIVERMSVTESQGGRGDEMTLTMVLSTFARTAGDPAAAAPSITAANLDSTGAGS